MHRPVRRNALNQLWKKRPFPFFLWYKQIAKTVSRILFLVNCVSVWYLKKHRYINDSTMRRFCFYTAFWILYTVSPVGHEILTFRVPQHMIFENNTEISMILLLRDTRTKVYPMSRTKWVLGLYHQLDIPVYWKCFTAREDRATVRTDSSALSGLQGRRLECVSFLRGYRCLPWKQKR